MTIARLKKEIAEMQRYRDSLRQDIEQVDQYLKPKQQELARLLSLEVTDHFLVRYLERFEDVDIDSFKDHIRDLYRDGEIRGYKPVVIDNKLVTIYKE